MIRQSKIYLPGGCNFSHPMSDVVILVMNKIAIKNRVSFFYSNEMSEFIALILSL